MIGGKESKSQWKVIKRREKKYTDEKSSGTDEEKEV